jgi:hypothetical protein
VLRRLRAAADDVVVITDTPRVPLDAPACVSEHMKELRRCAFARRPASAKARAVSDALRGVDGVRMLDPTDLLCLEDLCPSVIGDVLVYRNSGHLTASFAATMGPWLGRRLPPSR